MENAPLFFKIALWVIWPIAGICLGLFVGRLKNLNFSIYFLISILVYMSVSLASAVLSGLLITSFLYYEGHFINWGVIYLHFVIQFSMFYIVSLITTWLVKKITQK